LGCVEGHGLNVQAGDTAVDENADNRMPTTDRQSEIPRIRRIGCDSA